jgi:hypothetical protein
MIATMGATVLRRPRGAEGIADAVRALTVLSVPVAAVGWGPVAFAVLMISLLAVVVPRVLGLRPAFDIALCVLSLVAAWSSLLGWYVSVFLWDKVVHVSLCGALAALLVVIASDLAVVPAPQGAERVVVVVLSTLAGLALGSVWEMFEWVGHTFLDSTIRVGYDDTVGDLAADGAGSLAVGFLLPWLAGDRRVVGVDDRGHGPRPSGR